MTLLRTILVAGAMLSTTSVAQIEFKSWPVRQAPAELHSAISHADLVIVEMQGAVLHELSDAIARRGRDGRASVSATWTRRPSFSASAGRAARSPACTSDRLRNPANAPRAWAAPFVAAHAGKRAATVEGFVVDLGDRIGVLRPIAEQAMCASCHGAPEQLAPGVDLVRRQRYPADRAVGFRDGEIRGWFWVETAKRP